MALEYESLGKISETCDKFLRHIEWLSSEFH